MKKSGHSRVAIEQNIRLSARITEFSRGRCHVLGRTARHLREALHHREAPPGFGPLCFADRGQLRGNDVVHWLRIGVSESIGADRSTRNAPRVIKRHSVESPRGGSGSAASSVPNVGARSACTAVIASSAILVSRGARRSGRSRLALFKYGPQISHSVITRNVAPFSCAHRCAASNAGRS